MPRSLYGLGGWLVGMLGGLLDLVEVQARLVEARTRHIPRVIAVSGQAVHRVDGRRQGLARPPSCHLGRDRAADVDRVHLPRGVAQVFAEEHLAELALIRPTALDDRRQAA